MSTNSIDDGGPAFPLPLGNESVFPSVAGMTLRDFFAAKAMASLIACAENHGDIPHSHAAVDAYRYANAMLKAR